MWNDTVAAQTLEAQKQEQARKEKHAQELKQLCNAINQTNMDRKKEDPQPQPQGAPGACGGEPGGEGSQNAKDPGEDGSASVPEEGDMAAVADSKRKAESNLEPAGKNGCEIDDDDDDELLSPDLQQMQELAKEDNSNLSLEQIQQLDKNHGIKFAQAAENIRKATEKGRE